jgi:hypothetical protein
MKKILVMIIALGTMTGCKKNDTKKADEATFIGKWYVKTVVTSGTLGNSTNTSFTDQDYYLFKSDNTVNISKSTPAVTAILNYSYINEASGQSIMLSNADRIDLYKISKLTTDSLVMTTTGNLYSSSMTNTSTYRLARK